MKATQRCLIDCLKGDDPPPPLILTSKKMTKRSVCVGPFHYTFTLGDLHYHFNDHQCRRREKPPTKKKEKSIDHIFDPLPLYQINKMQTGNPKCVFDAVGEKRNPSQAPLGFTAVSSPSYLLGWCDAYRRGDAITTTRRLQVTKH